ncbi:hypothetical protein [Paraburkholderia phenazinium]|uniref:Uncharacterized protein n=1 Tax=Paraburkholderia phenazinium TaxID=60549 RepID=A0A1G8FJM9_9BURK|nr:hypothetical protein [Paraburkholderia phenazinium]SDH82311.1 hypothetical protein SAMN05216466_113213 [Paraburkholderia phenazinium]
MKTQPKFDADKPYGEGYSASEGRFFEQDGNVFHGGTLEFISKSEPEAKPKVESPHKFDPDKPHGHVMDASDRTIRYEQDGKLFAADGSFVKAV